MEKGFAPPSTESAPPYPGPPMNYPGPSHPSAPMLFPTGSAMHESAPPYPGPPSNYPGALPAQVPHPGGVYSAPMTTLTGPPFATRPRVIGPTYPYAYPLPVVTDPNIRVAYTPLGPFVHDVPRQTECPHCHQSVVTVTERTVGYRTWLMCLTIFALGCFPCSCIPFCIDTCKETTHRCPSCQKVMYFY